LTAPAGTARVDARARRPPESATVGGLSAPTVRESRVMYLLWFGVVLVLLRWLEIGPVAQLSWWWVLSPLAAAVLWFEVLESWFGRDRRKIEAIEHERLRQQRVRQQFDSPHRRG
jgi:small Trp-rich protein